MGSSMRDWLPNGLDPFSWVFAVLDFYSGRRFSNYDLRSNDQLEILALDGLTNYHRWRWPAARIYLPVVTGVYNDVPIILADDLTPMERAKAIASVADHCDIVYSTEPSSLHPKLLIAFLSLATHGVFISPLERRSSSRVENEVRAAKKLLGRAHIVEIEDDRWLLARKTVEGKDLPSWFLTKQWPTATADDDVPTTVIPVTNQIDFSIRYSIPGPIDTT